MKEKPNEYDKALETMTRSTLKMMTGTGTGLKRKPQKPTKPQK